LWCFWPNRRKATLYVVVVYFLSAHPLPPPFLKYLESVGSGFFRGKRLRREELDPVGMGWNLLPFSPPLGNDGTGRGVGARSSVTTGLWKTPRRERAMVTVPPVPYSSRGIGDHGAHPSTLVMVGFAEKPRRVGRPLSWRPPTQAKKRLEWATRLHRTIRGVQQDAARLGRCEGRVEVESEWTARRRERAEGKLCSGVELPHSSQRTA
jgi:hypothetical protein